ncbi:MAG: group III truncated hemoglobin [Piscinibacter sp.]
MTAHHTTREDLARLVDRFYADVFADPELGSLFAPLAGARWPEHRQRMTDFWCTTLLHTRSYRGNVMRKHQALLPALRPAHFGRWLTLWRRHLDGQLPPDDAAELFATARGIARNLHLGCFGHLPELVDDGNAVRVAA